MSSDGDSDLDYDPAVGDSDGSACDSDTSLSSESDEDYDEPIEPIVDAGWVYLTNPFEDFRPEAARHGHYSPAVPRMATPLY